MPKVSVVMSSYNHDKFVAKAIQSVLDQGFKDFEFLIIDDQSKDRTFEIEQEFEKIDPRIKVLKSPHNRGMVQNTNELIQMAQGEYIAIINSDDFWSLGKLEKQVEFLDNNPEYGACFTLGNLVDEKNEIVNSGNPFEYFEYDNYQWLYRFFYYGNCLCYPSSLVRKSCYEKVGPFDPAFICLLDFDMWIRICLEGYQIHIVNEKLTNFRVFDDQSNLSGQNQGSLVRDVLEAERIIANYAKIKNYDEFVKIFNQYSFTGSKNHQSYFYLVDLIVECAINKKRILNKRNILNFLLHFLHNKIFTNPQDLKILQEEFQFNFKKYLEITAMYPNGINTYKLKNYKKNVLHKRIINFFYGKI